MALTKPTGSWMDEDLLVLPDDGRRWEIIGGELYEMSGANTNHATVNMHLILRLTPVDMGIGGRISTAPVDDFFGEANPVEADINMLLPENRHLVRKRGIEGAPDPQLEVLSPLSPGHDPIRKRTLDARGGVHGDWIAGPEAASMAVLTVDGDVYRPHVRATSDEPVTSALLDVSFPASSIFTAIPA